MDEEKTLKDEYEKNRKYIPFSKLKDYLISLGYKIENDSDFVDAANMEQSKANERELKNRLKNGRIFGDKTGVEEASLERNPETVQVFRTDDESEQE